MHHTSISRIVFWDGTDDQQIVGTVVDVGEDDDYYYYYDFNNDDDFTIDDFPDYEDYKLGTRRKNRGKCIRVQKSETKGKEWVRKIGPLWRPLAQQIGIRRCKNANKQINEALKIISSDMTSAENKTVESNDAIRFGV